MKHQLIGYYSQRNLTCENSCQGLFLKVLIRDYLVIWLIFGGAYEQRFYLQNVTILLFFLVGNA